MFHNDLEIALDRLYFALMADPDIEIVDLDFQVKGDALSPLSASALLEEYTSTKVDWLRAELQYA